MSGIIGNGPQGPLHSGPAPYLLHDAGSGPARDDPRHDLPEGKPRNLLGNIACIAAVVGVFLVWALQGSAYLVGFAVSGAAIVMGTAALFTTQKRRTSAVAAVVIGFVPFAFTAIRVLVTAS